MRIHRVGTVCAAEAGPGLTLLLNWRFWVLIGLVAVLSFTHFTAYRKGKNEVRNEWKAAIAQANIDARALEGRRQSAADAAGRVAATAAHRDRVALAGARTELDGMRDTLSAIERASQESSDAARKHVTALSAVLGSCTREYLDMAEAAAGHARDAVMYQQAWPK